MARGKPLLIGSTRYLRGRRCTVQWIAGIGVGVLLDDGTRRVVPPGELWLVPGGPRKPRLPLRDRVRAEFLEIHGREPTAVELACYAGGPA